MKKRVLSLLVCAAIAATLCGCGDKTPSAPEPVQPDNDRVNPIEESKPEWEYKEDEDGITVEKYNGRDTVVKIPAEIDGKPVKRLGYFFGVENDVSTTLEIPSSVDYIPDGMLGENLTELIVEEGNENYYSEDGFIYRKLYNGNAEFFCCPQGKKGEVIVPDGVVRIGDSAFSGCAGITAVRIPESVTYIGTAFCNCTSLTSVNLPKTLIQISGYTFQGCTSLETLDIPETVTDISMHAFEGTPFLQKLIEQDPFVVINGILVDGTTLKGEVTIPDSVKKISYEAFAPYWGENTEITKITLPEGFTDTVAGVFKNCTALEEVRLPEGLTETGLDTFENCGSLKSIDLPSGLTKIGWYSFRRCTGLTSIDIPNGVTEIGMSAFQNCENLERVRVPDSVVDVGLNDCFDGCEKISVTFKGKTYTAANIEEFYKAVEENAMGDTQ